MWGSDECEWNVRWTSNLNLSLTLVDVKLVVVKKFSFNSRFDGQLFWSQDTSTMAMSDPLELTLLTFFFRNHPSNEPCNNCLYYLWPSWTYSVRPIVFVFKVPSSSLYAIRRADLDWNSTVFLFVVKKLLIIVYLEYHKVINFLYDT